MSKAERKKDTSGSSFEIGMTRIILHTYCSRLFWLIIYEQPMAVQTFSLYALVGADS